MKKLKAWDVYLYNHHTDKTELIDTVFDMADNANEVKCSLVDHDGYDPAIEVKRG